MGTFAPQKTLITQDKTFTAFPIRTDLIPYQLNPHFSPFLNKKIHWKFSSTVPRLERDTRKNFVEYFSSQLYSWFAYGHSHQAFVSAVDGRNFLTPYFKKKEKWYLLHFIIVSWVLKVFLHASHLFYLKGHHVLVPFEDISRTSGKTDMALTQTFSNSAKTSAIWKKKATELLNLAVVLYQYTQPASKTARQ